MIYLVTLEPAENRYTSQWKKWIKQEFIDCCTEVTEIDGNIVTQDTGNNKNFLNPNETNIWKSEQIIKISNLFKDKKIKENDKFLFYDAWHYGVIALRYMSCLNNIPVKIYGMWHAGSYDNCDLLGNHFNYFNTFEESLFKCLDKSFVATIFHKKLILSKNSIDSSLIEVTGFPYNFSDLDVYNHSKKENLIVFPHRMSKEKQPEILKDLEVELNKKGITCFFCQEHKLSKEQYYTILAKSKIVFSCSLQETWGIGCFEGLYLHALPLAPNRLSYEEMYLKTFLYDSVKTESWESYLKNKKQLLKILLYYIDNYSKIKKSIGNNIMYLKKYYCTFDKIRRIVNE